MLLRLQSTQQHCRFSKILSQPNLSEALGDQMSDHRFLTTGDVVPMVQAMTRLAARISSGGERQSLLALAEVDAASISSLPLDGDPARFAQQIVALFKTYQVSRERPDYHPMLQVLVFLTSLPETYGLIDAEIDLFQKIIAHGQEILRGGS